jgi:hypothetical protein
MRCAKEECGARCINRGPGSLCRDCTRKAPGRKRQKKFWQAIETLEGVVQTAMTGGEVGTGKASGSLRLDGTKPRTHAQAENLSAPPSTAPCPHTSFQLQSWVCHTGRRLIRWKCRCGRLFTSRAKTVQQTMATLDTVQRYGS